MNPWAIVAGIALAVALWFGGDYTGHKIGVNEQKVADQMQFDKINKDLSEQKSAANMIYRNAQANIIALQADRDRFKTQLEKTYAENQTRTNALRAEYAGRGLRFSTDQGARCGAGSTGTVSASTDTASTSPATVIQLPSALTADIRSLNYDADQLADDYRKCYAYANKVK